MASRRAAIPGARFAHRRLYFSVALMIVDMRQDMARLGSRVDERISVLESRLREDMKQLSERVARMEHGQAKLEGLLEGLREAITGRARAS